MSDLIVLIHSENNPRRFQKTREDTTPKRRARRPAPPTGWPAPRAHLSDPVAMLVLHRLLDCIYAVLLSQFDPRVQN